MLKHKNAFPEAKLKSNNENYEKQKSKARLINMGVIEKQYLESKKDKIEEAVEKELKNVKKNYGLVAQR